MVRQEQILSFVSTAVVSSVLRRSCIRSAFAVFCVCHMVVFAAYGWTWTGKTGDVTLDSGTTRITDADIADVENVALTGISIPADGRLVFERTRRQLRLRRIFLVKEP
ncbi:MAG: hypothetical protein IKE55_04010 [Kiritimatiellae bacterium]|nr:hypothetical protein [Kiritimatiellia bacterium]